MVILRGEAATLREWQRTLAARYRPDTLVIALQGDFAGLPPALAKPAPASGSHGVNAWLCMGVTCLPPVADLGTIERLLEQGFNKN